MLEVLKSALILLIYISKLELEQIERGMENI